MSTIASSISMLAELPSRLPRSEWPQVAAGQVPEAAPVGWRAASRERASSSEISRLPQPESGRTSQSICGIRWPRGSGKRKAKAPEPIALVGLECGVDDAGDDEERVPLKTFSHRMGPDAPGSPIPRTNAS